MTSVAPLRLRGLVAATFTPFDAEGALSLEPIEALAVHLASQGVDGAFVNGSTGEGLSLSVEERKAQARRWAEVLQGSGLRCILHVGHLALPAARELAAHARESEVDGIAALAPSYVKPADVARLIDWCAAIAGEAPEIPFYYYDIPDLTGVRLPMAEFLLRGRERIPNLCGIKFTNHDLVELQRVVAAVGDELDVWWGFDELLLAGWSLGAHGAVGSSYNFAGPMYRRLLDAAEAGDLVTARALQLHSVRLIETLHSFGFLPACKAFMQMLGFEVGGPRAPLAALDADRRGALRAGLEGLGCFEGGLS